MAVQIEVIEERLKSFLRQLQAESAILERIVYKNKNQHRRASYFQWLLKVRRDLKVLHAIHMDELLDSCFLVISGRKAKVKANLLESLKRNRHETGKFNFLERLLGAARLLSEMVEPMLKTSIDISTLLARSFFMGFSLTVLALLARLRVLVQQMLLDVVELFNELSSIAQKKQSIKITQNGIEVFREYYPVMEEAVTLECVWKADKFVLVETVSKCEIEHQDEDSRGKLPAGASVQYQSVEAFLGEDEVDAEIVDAENNGEESFSNLKRKQPESSPLNNDDHNEQLEAPRNSKDSSEDVNRPNRTIVMEGPSTSSAISDSFAPKSVSYRRVAFVSVDKQVQLASSAPNFPGKESESKENPLFDLFNSQHTKGSIF